MANFKRKKQKMKKGGVGNAKNGSWSRMIHKWWIRYYQDKCKYI